MLTLAHRAMLGAASRPKPPVQVIGLASSGAATEQGYSVSVDSSGNRFFAGLSVTSPRSGFLAKFDAGGTLEWQRAISFTTFTAIYDCCVDASGNVYVCGMGRVSGTINYGFVAKYSAAGVLQWQRKISHSKAIELMRLAIGPGGDVFAVGTNSDTKIVVVLVKYSSGGTLQWQKVISHASNSLGTSYGISIDSSGNIYFGATWVATSVSNEWPIVVKCNSSGVVLAVYAIRIMSRANGTVYSTAIDASGNVYCSGICRNGSSVYEFIAKLNDSGAVQWCKRFFDVSSVSSTSSICLSDDGGYVFHANGSYILKIAAADGALDWRRQMTGPGSVFAGLRIEHKSSFLHTATSIGGMPSSGTDALLCKLPDSGDGISAYGLLTYSEPALTATAESLDTATPTISAATGSFTEAAGDMTDVAGALTVTNYS